MEIPVPAIVDESTFARAQELLHENKVHARRRTVDRASCRGWSVARNAATRSRARRAGRAPGEFTTTAVSDRTDGGMSRFSVRHAPCGAPG